MNKRFNRERGPTRRLWLGLLALGGVLLLPIVGLRHSGARAQSAATVVDAKLLHPALTAKQLKTRDTYWASKQGFAHGVPNGAFANAIQQVNEEESSGTLRKLSSADLATSLSWQFLGPDPINLLTFFTTGVVFGSPHTGAGSFTAVAVDTSGNVFAGSADGGVYFSSNGGSTFSQVFNNQPTQSIGAIAIDTTTSPNTVYVGTGNPNGNVDSYYGGGVFRSTDLGNTWTQIMPASFANGAVAVSKIALDPANKIVFVGATWGTSSNRAGASNLEAVDVSQEGLWVSTDNGNTFTQYSPPSLGNCYITDTSVPCPVDDVEIDPATNSGGSHNVYVAVDEKGNIGTNFGGIFRSTTEGLSSGSPGVFTSLIPGKNRSAIAIGSQLSNAAASQAYFTVADQSGIGLLGFWYAKDGGTAPLVRSNPPQFPSGGVTFDGSSPNNQTNSFYSQTLAVYPRPPAATAGLIYGGVGIYRTTNNSKFVSIVNQTQGGAAANQHALAFDSATGQMLLADDGGLYSFDPAQNSNVTFTSLNTTIDTTLVQSIGPHPKNDGLLWAGFEGAGTEQYQGSANNWAFPASEAGDGGFVMYDPDDTNYVYHTYSNGDLDANVSFAYSANGGTSWNSNTPSKNLSNQLKLVGDPGAAFYPPIAVDPTTPHRVFFGAHAVYVSNDGGTTWVPQAFQDLTGLCSDGSCALEDIEPVSHSNGWALAMADPFLNYPFVLANTTSLNLDTTNGAPGGTWSLSPTQSLSNQVPLGSTQATGIAVDHNNPLTAYISLSGFYGGAAGTGVGHIYKTTDFGNTWAEADGGTAQSNPPATALPDVPVLRVLVDQADTTGNALYAATDIGVFKSSDGGNTWGSLNQGVLQAIPVFDIEQNQNNTIFIGTHGKGVYQLVSSAPSTPSPTATPSSTPSGSPTASPTPVPGTLTVSPASVTFSTQAFGQIGNTSPPKTITVTNPKKGKTPPAITITNIALTSDSNGSYNIVNNGCQGQTLQPLQKCQMIVTYTPLVATKSTGSITVANNGTKSLAVKLAGTGSPVTITAKPASLSFGKVTIGTPSSPLSATLTNKNNVPVTISGQNTGGKFPGDYASVTAANNPCGSTLAANSTCNVAAAFTPTAKGSRPATLVISGTLKSPVTIKLSGTGQ